VLRTYGLSGDGVHPITALNSLVLMTPTGDRLWGVFVFNADLLYAPQDLTLDILFGEHEVLRRCDRRPERSRAVTHL
jgi:hypothetical protein